MGLEEKQNSAWMDISHPNYERWNRSRLLADERGRFVRSLISQKKDCRKLSVLDLGSGEGGTSRVFSDDNFVVSLDFSFDKLKRQKSLCADCSMVNASALDLPFLPSGFDVIIMQDVIEHIEGNLISLPGELLKLLKPGGVIYLSTPNRHSLLNLLADPHWGLPFVSAMNRKTIRKFVLPAVRKQDVGRTGIAQLLSLNDLKRLFGRSCKLELNTLFAVTKLFEGSRAIVWSSFHLSLLHIIKQLRLDHFILKLSNNSEGIVNKYFTPTFYFLITPGE